MKKRVQAGVVATWLILMGIGIYGVSQMHVDADVNDFLPSGSYVLDFFDTWRDQFGETGTEVSLYWVNDAQVRGPHELLPQGFC